MLQWHFSCLLFVGFAYSSDFKLLRSSWRNTTASCADLLQHLPSQSQPYQPDNGKSYSEPDDKCYLPKNGSTSCKYSVLYYSVCVCSLSLAWTLWYTTPNHIKYVFFQILAPNFRKGGLRLSLCNETHFRLLWMKIEFQLVLLVF